MQSKSSGGNGLGWARKAGCQTAPTQAPEGQAIATFAGIRGIVLPLLINLHSMLSDSIGIYSLTTLPAGEALNPVPLGTSDAIISCDEAHHSFCIGGCFWGLQLAYDRVPGVTASTVGYTGGQDPSPNYNSVCGGRTGHAEAIQVGFQSFGFYTKP